MPIGEDDGGNVVCLKVRGEDRGAVYFWDPRRLRRHRSVKRLADGFDEFFEALRPVDELGLDH